MWTCAGCVVETPAVTSGRKAGLCAGRPGQGLAMSAVISGVGAILHGFSKENTIYTCMTRELVVQIDFLFRYRRRVFGCIIYGQGNWVVQSNVVDPDLHLYPNS